MHIMKKKEKKLSQKINVIDADKKYMNIVFVSHISLPLYTFINGCINNHMRI